MLRLSVISIYFAIISSLSSCTTYDGPVTAKNSEAKALNQIWIQKNGCGPASLINAYRFGSPKWNTALDRLPGTSDKEKFNNLVNRYGTRVFSSHLQRQRRYDPKYGINILDLTDLANHFQTDRKLTLPELKYNSLFLSGEMDHEKLFKTAHKQLVKSLNDGFPPLLSLKTFAKKNTRWTQVYGHFVTLYEIPSKLPAGATSFEVKYIDPWGGSIKTGTIKIPEKSFYATNLSVKKQTFLKSPTLEIDFPESHLGLSQLKPNQASATILAFSITPK